MDTTLTILFHAAKVTVVNTDDRMFAYDIAGCEYTGHESEGESAYWHILPGESLCSGSPVTGYEDGSVMNAPGIGFKVGGRTGIRYLVFAVHYHYHGAHVPHGLTAGSTSKITIDVTLEKNTPDHPIKSAAFIELTAPWGPFPAKTEKAVNSTITITEDLVARISSCFLHEHGHVTTANAYKIDHTTGHEQLIASAGGDRPAEEFLLSGAEIDEPYGKYVLRRPGLVDKSAVLRQGDNVTLVCNFFNHEDHVINIGFVRDF